MKTNNKKSQSYTNSEMKKMYLKKTITTISLTLLAAMAAFAQTSATAALKDNDNKTVIEVYNIMKEQGGGSIGKGKSGKGKSNNNAAPPKVNISGYAVKVGPDVYGLPSVELSETKGGKVRALCVLPFTDYLKLRHVSKGDQVVMQGEVRGYADEYDFVLVKQSKIVSVNGKKP
ncbi:MAG: hypothetical protein HDR86_04415 [Bacteroides sp.]|nr:hypothetical protein [Bacteroides sp.]